MSDPLFDTLFETFCWTGALIVAVLALRRPVARWFGPQAAYLLWLLPLARLALPPLVLPHEWAPVEPVVASAASAASAVDTAPITALGTLPVDTAAAAAPAAIPFDLTLITLTIWLTGAALFLFGRYHGYFTMRRELMRGARCVGRVGRIRLVETPLTRAPLAFGLFDPVIAVPPGFMAQHDRTARDLALAHELAHHRGHDLLMNFAVQPLFALHWFNPLAYLGWRALRRDQETACDARVMRVSAPEQRAVYAGVIASFATGPNLGLAAPMACPVLGDKSIIHRLRSLSMSDFSLRRRFAGRALVGAALLALPLTATISYAEPGAAPLPPVAPEAPPMPDLPQLPDAPLPPMAPLPPEAPLAPAAPGTVGDVRTTRADLPGVSRETVVHWNGRRIDPTRLSASERAEFEADMAQVAADTAEAMADVREAMAEAEEALAEAGLARREALAEAMTEQREALAEARAARSEALAIAGANRREALAVARAMPRISVVKGRCADGSAATTEKMRGDHKVITVCTANFVAEALKGLAQARRTIEQDARIGEDVRREILRSLDREIASFKDRNG